MTNGAIQVNDLDKHFGVIIGSDKLKNLTAEQIEIVALLMESAFQKGKEEAAGENESTTQKICNGVPYSGYKPGCISGLVQGEFVNTTINIKADPLSAKQVKQAIDEHCKKLWETFKLVGSY